MLLLPKQSYHSTEEEGEKEYNETTNVVRDSVTELLRRSDYSWRKFYSSL